MKVERQNDFGQLRVEIAGLRAVVRYLAVQWSVN